MHNIPPMPTATGSPPSGPSGSQTALAKKILEYVLAHIFEFKKLNQVCFIQGNYALLSCSTNKLFALDF